MTEYVSDYRIVEATNPDDLVLLVKTCLDNGWHLNGSAFYSEKYLHFYQPMVKYQSESTSYRGPW